VGECNVGKTNQRGLPRAFKRCDIGAYESTETINWIVNKTTDEDSGYTCVPNGGTNNNCSLRAAIAAATGYDTITFDSAVFVETAQTPIFLRKSRLAIIEKPGLRILGPGRIPGSNDYRLKITIDYSDNRWGWPGAENRIVAIMSPSVVLSEMEIETPPSKYAVVIESANVVVSSVYVVRNPNVYASQLQKPSGLYSNGQNVTVTNVTVSGFTGVNNLESDQGAAIDLRGGSLNVLNSTFTNNEMLNGFNGGAIYARDTSSLKVVNSTFQNNVADDGSAIWGTRVRF
jgi:hypothetical protein